MDRGRGGGGSGVTSVIVMCLMLLGAFTGFSRQGSAHVETALSHIPGLEGEAWDVNDQGQIVGLIDTVGNAVAFLVNPKDVNADGRLEWYQDKSPADGVNDLMQTLGSVSPGGYSEADAINSHGVIVGCAWDSLHREHAYVIIPQDSDDDSIPDTWFKDSFPYDGVNDLMIDLGAPYGAVASWCLDLNDRNTVVGCLVYPAGAHGHPYRTTEAAMFGTGEGCVRLGTLGGTNSTASAVSDTGVVVGYADSTDGRQHAFVINPVWINGSYSWYRDSTPADGINDLMRDLGSIGESSAANGVNVGPTVVGWTNDPVNGQQSVKWENVSGVWTKTNLWPSGEAMCINELGVIAGWHIVGSVPIPLVLDDVFGLHDVDTAKGKPWSINNLGQIAGTLIIDPSWEYRPAVWTTHQRPSAVFTAEPTTGLTMQFDGSLSNAWDGTIVSYDWNFDDGSTGTGVAPQHTFGSEGTYDVTMKVTNDDRLWQTLTRTLVVAAPNEPPIASFTVSVTGMSITADASASTDDGTIVAYDWNFDDGEIGTGVVAEHTYAEKGTYTIGLTVSDDDHAVSSAVYDVTVGSPNKPPVAGMRLVIVTGMSVFVDASPPGSYDSDGTIVAYYWDFGDGTKKDGMILYYTYAAEGTYTINLTVMDNEGAFGFAERVVSVSATNLQPIASWSETVTGLSVSFDAGASYDSDGSIASYSWWFNDGSPSESGEIASHTFSAAGTYQVELKVTDNEGACGWLNKSVTVNAAPVGPVADFTVNIDGLTVGFDASVLSYDPDGTIVSYSWWFDDLSPNGTGATVSHTYATGGTYNVCLKVTDNDGYGELAIKPVTVSPPNVAPVAGFSAVPTYLSVAFDASYPHSYDSDGWIVSFDWDFGDYSTDTGWTVVHNFWRAGSYTVTLTVTDDDGLTSNATCVVTATEAPPPEVEPTIIELETLILDATDPYGMPIDNMTQQSLELKVDIAMSILGMRKTSGSAQAVEMRKTSGANLLVVFNGMVETYTLAGKLSGYDGWNLTSQANFVISLLANQIRIADVPNFEWYCGCCPTAAGMVMAYWDAHGFGGLVKGENGLLQTPEINDMIASPQHILDYALVPDPNDPLRVDDSLGELIQDNSTADPLHHENNCLADFMHTSWSADRVGYGLTLLSKVVDGLVQYTANAPRLTESNAKYIGYAKELTAQSFKWENLRYQIDTKHPMLVAVDVNGDGSTDHLVTVVGYCQIGSARLYAFHSTWENTIYWGTFEMMKKEVCYGVYSGFIYDIVDVTPSQT